MMVLQLPNSICSQQDVNTLIREVRDYAQWFSHNTIKQRIGSTAQTAQPHVSSATSELLTAWAHGKAMSPAVIDALLRELATYQSTAPTLTITLAAPATNDIKQLLVDWCRANIAPNALVSFRFNSSLLGGMVVRYKSRVFDWSFRRKILTEKAKFPEILRRV